jgi:hypothetical protein
MLAFSRCKTRSIEMPRQDSGAILLPALQIPAAWLTGVATTRSGSTTLQFPDLRRAMLVLGCDRRAACADHGWGSPAAFTTASTEAPWTAAPYAAKPSMRDVNTDHQSAVPRRSVHSSSRSRPFGSFLGKTLSGSPSLARTSHGLRHRALLRGRLRLPPSLSLCSSLPELRDWFRWNVAFLEQFERRGRRATWSQTRDEWLRAENIPVNLLRSRQWRRTARYELARARPVRSYPRRASRRRRGL